VDTDYLDYISIMLKLSDIFSDRLRELGIPFEYRAVNKDMHIVSYSIGDTSYVFYPAVRNNCGEMSVFCSFLVQRNGRTFAHLSERFSFAMKVDDVVILCSDTIKNISIMSIEDERHFKLNQLCV
jgi:hypothetical protein